MRGVAYASGRVIQRPGSPPVGDPVKFDTISVRARERGGSLRRHVGPAAGEDRIGSVRTRPTVRTVRVGVAARTGVVGPYGSLSPGTCSVLYSRSHTPLYGAPRAKSRVTQHMKGAQTKV